MRAQLDFRSLPKAIFGQAQSAKKGWPLPQLLLHVLQMGQGAAEALAWGKGWLQSFKSTWTPPAPSFRGIKGQEQ